MKLGNRYFNFLSLCDTDSKTGRVSTNGTTPNVNYKYHLNSKHL